MAADAANASTPGSGARKDGLPHRDQVWKRYNFPGGPSYLSRRMQALIQLAAHGDFDTTAPTGMSLETAARIVHLQKRAVRRLQESDIFLNALREAQSRAEAVRRAQRPAEHAPAPAAPVAPPSAPAPAPAAPSARQDAVPCISERDAPAEFVRMVRLDATHERVGCFVNAPADYAEPEPEPAPAPTPMGLPWFDMTSTIRMRPSPGYDASRPAQRTTSVQAAPRRSLRRS
jgi:hypothetical protein